MTILVTYHLEETQMTTETTNATTHKIDVNVEKRWIECDLEQNKFLSLPNIKEGLKSLGFYDQYGIWLGCSNLEREKKIQEIVEATENHDGFRLCKPRNQYSRYTWEKEYAIATFSWRSEIATIKSHEYRDILLGIESAEIWDADSDMPCIGMKGIMTTKAGGKYHLSGARDVGMRTGYTPRLSVYPIECAAP